MNTEMKKRSVETPEPVQQRNWQAPPFDIYDGLSMWVGSTQALSSAAGRGFGDAIEPGEEVIWTAPLTCTPVYTDWTVHETPLFRIYVDTQTRIPRSVTARSGRARAQGSTILVNSR